MATQVWTKDDRLFSSCNLVRTSCWLFDSTQKKFYFLFLFLFELKDTFLFKNVKIAVLQ